MGRAPVLLLAFSCVATAAGGQTPPARPQVLVAELEGIIHPISAEYLTETIDESDTSGAALVIIVLRTPGGLLESTRTIVSRMITSRAPVAVLVAPSGARAASAGFVITVAADIAAMAPGTHIGAAHPVSGTGEPQDETVSEKAASDTAAYVRSLAAARGRNVALAEEAVLKSRAFTEGEAREATPPLIDLVVPDVDALLHELDGRTVTRFDGRTTTLALANAETRRTTMSWRQRFLGALAHPQIAAMLLTLGMLGLTIELWNPGAIFPGVIGGLCLLLAFFAFQIVPVSTAGLLLVVFGIGLLVLELKVPSFGILGIGGVVSLMVGSIMMSRTVPGVSVSFASLVPVVVITAAGVLVLGGLALRAQRQRPVTGMQGLIGGIGLARTPLSADAPGQVDIRGEIWRAVSAVPVAVGQSVRVRGHDGLTLRVEPAADRE
jgi:membrane-bound serine protease (ClpP class)